MSKKVLIILVLGVLLLGGGYALFRMFQTQQEQQTYAASPNKVADDFLNDLKMQNAKAAYDNLITDTLKSCYSENYWEKQYFPLFKTMTSPSLVGSTPVKSDTTKPAAYPLNTDAQSLVYRFKVQATDYLLTIIILKNGSSPWKIDSISGDFKAAQ
jgi:hypothetical protein